MVHAALGGFEPIEDITEAEVDVGTRHAEPGVRIDRIEPRAPGEDVDAVLPDRERRLSFDGRCLEPAGQRAGRVVVTTEEMELTAHDRNR